jgi:hypothetical protein
MDKDLNKDIIQEHYLLALIDISNGVDISELESTIDFYEEIENYEACAGILKAINSAGYKTIKEIKKTIKDE